jgi:hypothetical protein
MRGAEDVADGPSGENDEILDCGDGRFQEVEQTVVLIKPMLPC